MDFYAAYEDDDGLRIMHPAPWWFVRPIVLGQHEWLDFTFIQKPDFASRYAHLPCHDFGEVTAYHWAADHCYWEAIIVLLEHSVRLNAVTIKGTARQLLDKVFAPNMDAIGDREAFQDCRDLYLQRKTFTDGT